MNEIKEPFFGRYGNKVFVNATAVLVFLVAVFLLPFLPTWVTPASQGYLGGIAIGNLLSWWEVGRSKKGVTWKH